ncbi:MAG: hypothetical protein IJ566_00910 [Cardiobacteriaceae bacterium]|nr:hypothetical protein [Cardiobacteriaceae bacterium]
MFFTKNAGDINKKLKDADLADKFILMPSKISLKNQQLFAKKLHFL